MKIFIVNKSDSRGGAARAAYRTHLCLRSIGIDSKMIVDNKETGDWTVIGPNGNIEKFIRYIKPQLIKPINFLFKRNNDIVQSFNLFPSKWLKFINNSEVDIVNLHWINGEMLSIEQISKIKKPIVWTLHDMWAICGSEHYTTTKRWERGYISNNRLPNEIGIDIDKWCWRRKVRNWRKTLTIVCPSNDLAKCVKKSFLFRDNPIHVIPNPIDTEKWRPIEKANAKELLKISQETKLILFGAIGGTKDPRKGFDLLIKSLKILKETRSLSNIKLLIFGQLQPKEHIDFGFPTIYAGHLHDDLSLDILYSASELMIVPSRQEILPLTAQEAIACGTPVVGFDIGGLEDIVVNKSNGYLAKPFNTNDLANGIEWVINNNNKGEISSSARSFAIKKFSRKNISKKYLKIFEEIHKKNYKYHEY